VAELVVPGVWWLHETRGSNVFTVERDDGGLTLVDTGFASSADGIVSELAAIAPGMEPSHILLTHGHVDHAGAAAELRRRYSARVVAGVAECDVDAQGRHLVREPMGRSHLVRRIRRRVARRAGVLPEVQVDVPLQGEQRIAGVLAVPVPGHTPGSYCYLLEGRGVAFVGDLVICHRDVLARAMTMTNFDDALYLQTLRDFAPRAPAVGCAGHGVPWREGFGDELRVLAALPRRSLLSPGGARDRVRRMRDFARAISRVRRAGSALSGEDRGGSLGGER